MIPRSLFTDSPEQADESTGTSPGRAFLTGTAVVAVAMLGFVMFIGLGMHCAAGTASCDYTLEVVVFTIAAVSLILWTGLKPPETPRSKTSAAYRWEPERTDEYERKLRLRPDDR